LFTELSERGAFAILKNSSQLTSKEFEEVKVNVADTKQIEQQLIDEHVSGKVAKRDAKELAKNLLNVLNTSKQEGETNYTFEKRVKEEIDKILF